MFLFFPLIIFETIVASLPTTAFFASISNHELLTSDFVDPDLLIRTSGESRISNFLLWQIAYTEIYFSKVLWPDFNEDELDKAVLDFNLRDRRYGNIRKEL